MRKMLIILSAMTCLFAFGVAQAADDGASIFKSHCQACHGADGSRAPMNGVAPLKGMSSADIQSKLAGYKDGSFGGQGKQVMQGVVKQLSEDQVKSVADYAAGL